MKSTLSIRLAFSLALLVHIIATVIWYGTQPHTSPMMTYVPNAWVSFCGLLVGLSGRRLFFQKISVLAVILAVTGAIMHWGAAQLGVPVDLGTASSAFTIGIILIPVGFVFCVIGAALGILCNQFK